MDTGYRLNVLVENRILLEIAVVDTLLPIHEAQPLTDLKFSK